MGGFPCPPFPPVPSSPRGGRVSPGHSPMAVPPRGPPPRSLVSGPSPRSPVWGPPPGPRMGPPPGPAWRPTLSGPPGRPTLKPSSPVTKSEPPPDIRPGRRGLSRLRVRGRGLFLFRAVGGARSGAEASIVAFLWSWPLGAFLWSVPRCSQSAPWPTGTYRAGLWPPGLLPLWVRGPRGYNGCGSVAPRATTLRARGPRGHNGDGRGGHGAPTRAARLRLADCRGAGGGSRGSRGCRGTARVGDGTRDESGAVC